MSRPGTKNTQRRFWLWFLVLGLGVLLLGVLLWPGTSDTEFRLQRLRAAGLPTNPSELDAWYAAPSADHNLATPLLNAATALRTPRNTDTNLPFLGRARVPSRGKRLEQPLLANLQGFIRTNQEALNEAHIALQRSQARFPVNLAGGWTARMNHFGPLRMINNSFALEAWLAADRGDADGALRSLLSALHLGDSLRTEPIMVSNLVAMGCLEVTVTVAEHVISRGILNPEQLVALQKAFELTLTHQSLERAFVGQICLGDEIRRLTPSQALQWASGPADTWEEQAQEACLWLYSAAGMLRRDYAFVVACWDDLRLISQSPFPERIQQVQDLESGFDQRLGRSYLPLARNFIGNTGDSMRREARYVARLKAVATSCVIESYRLSHANELPASLEALVPAFLNQVPTDPFDGQPLRFRILTNGYVIYSLGPDGRDDGGREVGKRVKSDPGWDVTFVVENW